MPPAPASAAGRHDGLLRELTEDECWQHLEQHQVGRISYVDRGCPVILPLNYLARDEQIWVRTASYNQLAIHLPGQRAAFEIDHIDEHTHTGWSVLVRGVAEHALGEHPTPPAGWADPTPWPDGTRTMVFCLTALEVSGRQLRQGDVTPPAGQRPGTVQRQGR